MIFQGRKGLKFPFSLMLTPTVFLFQSVWCCFLILARIALKVNFVDNSSGYTTICMYVAEDMKRRLASEELRSELFNTGANHRSIIRYINQ